MDKNSMGVRITKDPMRSDIISTEGNRDSIPSPNNTTIATLFTTTRSSVRMHVDIYTHKYKAHLSYPMVISSTTNMTLTNVLTRSPKAAAPISPYVVELGQASKQRAINLAV